MTFANRLKLHPGAGDDSGGVIPQPLPLSELAQTGPAIPDQFGNIAPVESAAGEVNGDSSGNGAGEEMGPEIEFTAPALQPPLGVAPGAAFPNAPGRDNFALDGAPPEIANATVPAGEAMPAPPTPNSPASPAVVSMPVASARDEQSLADQIMPIFRDGMADTLSVARDTLTRGATYYAPLIARQALMETSDDETVRKRAAGHRRHLGGQLLAEGATRGIPLQQRHETRLLAVLNTAIAAGVNLLTGGVAGAVRSAVGGAQ